MSYEFFMLISTLFLNKAAEMNKITSVHYHNTGYFTVDSVVILTLVHILHQDIIL
jgi:hypothetical protein